MEKSFSLQVRVPLKLHSTAKTEAGRRGQTLRVFTLRALEHAIIGGPDSDLADKHAPQKKRARRT